MSWLFSQALGVEYSAGTSLDGAPFAQLNVMPTEHPFWRRGKTMDVSSPSQSGLTLQPLTATHGVELLTSFLLASRARISARPAKAKGSTEANPASIEKSPESWTRFDPASATWKIAQCSLLGDSEPFLGTWPRSGLMRNGVCSAQAMSDSLTPGTAYGFALPTPSGVNGGRNNMMGRVDEWGGSSNPLRGTLIGSMCLPAFEELVMGWPIGWTEPTAFAMDKFRAWQQQHGGF